MFGSVSTLYVQHHSLTTASLDVRDNRTTDDITIEATMLFITQQLWEVHLVAVYKICTCDIPSSVIVTLATAGKRSTLVSVVESTANKY